MNKSVHTSCCKHLLKVIRLNDAEELPGRPRTGDQWRGAFVIVVKCWLCLFHFFRRFRRLDSGNGNQKQFILNVCCVLLICTVCFCTGLFVMVPLNLTLSSLIATFILWTYFQFVKMILIIMKHTFYTGLETAMNSTTISQK